MNRAAAAALVAAALVLAACGRCAAAPSNTTAAPANNTTVTGSGNTPARTAGAGATTAALAATRAGMASCIKAVTGTGYDYDGRVTVYVDQGQGFQAATEVNAYYGAGATVLDECYGALAGVRVQNTNDNVWGGSITFARGDRDRAGPYTAGACATCTKAGSSGAIVVDGDSRSVLWAGHTSCLGGAMCDIQLPPRVKASPGWAKGENGANCGHTCAARGLVCGCHSSAEQSKLVTKLLVGNAFAEAGYTCKSYGYHMAHSARENGTSYAGAPFSKGTDADDCALFQAGDTSPSCTANHHSHHAPLCYCQEPYAVHGLVRCLFREGAARARVITTKDHNESGAARVVPAMANATSPLGACQLACDEDPDCNFVSFRADGRHCASWCADPVIDRDAGGRPSTWAERCGWDTDSCSGCPACAGADVCAAANKASESNTSANPASGVPVPHRAHGANNTSRVQKEADLPVRPAVLAEAAAAAAAAAARCQCERRCTRSSVLEPSSCTCPLARRAPP